MDTSGLISASALTPLVASDNVGPGNSTQGRTEDSPHTPPLPNRLGRSVASLRTVLASKLGDGEFVTASRGSESLAGSILDFLYEHKGLFETAQHVATAIAQLDRVWGLYDIVRYAEKELAVARKEEEWEAGRLRSYSSPLKLDRRLQEDHEQEGDGTAGTENQSIPFFEFPAEMRNNVYRHLLARSGYITLPDRRPWAEAGYRPSGRPQINNCFPQILATCRQVCREGTAILYEENTVVISVMLREDCLSVISKTDLPDHVLPRIKSLVLVIADYFDLDYSVEELRQLIVWKPLQQLTKLKTIRICIVKRRHTKSWHIKNHLREITMRIPADCEVAFSARHGEEAKAVQEVLDAWDLYKKAIFFNVGDVVEMTENKLQGFARLFRWKKGCKSGEAIDYRFVGGANSV